MDNPGNDDYHSDLGALDFSDPTDSETGGGDLQVLSSLTEHEEDPELDQFTVANPSKSVSVTALMDGRIQKVELSDHVERMSEPQLAEEIFVLADLARQKARAAQYTFLLESLRGDEQGTESLRQLVDLTLTLPTPEEAAAAQEKVFANRYFGDSYGDNE